MDTLSNSIGTILVLLAVCFFGPMAQAKYSGGTGDPNEPYQITTAEDLMLLGESPEDYDKHFKLMADIDLSAFDGKDGRPAFTIIGDSEEHVLHVDVGGVYLSGTPFTGVFDGNGHIISHLTAINAHNDGRGLFGGLACIGQILNLGVLDVNVNSSNGPVGGLVAYNHGTITRCYSTGIVTGQRDVGGLVGSNLGSIIASYSTCVISGDSCVGGLLGSNWEDYVSFYVGRGSILYYNSQGRVAQCYSTGRVSGNRVVGGLVGANENGDVIQCYSSGLVSGTENVGGLVGAICDGSVLYSFWDIETSGQATSTGGKGMTTSEMQTSRTFLIWGTCGNEGTWTIDEGNDYPRLAWENLPGEAIILSPLSDLLLGMGTQIDPFLINTAEELYMVGLFPCEWDKCFKLMVDVDLSGFDGKEGRPVFNTIGNRAEAFTGVFDGNAHTISHLTIEGDDYLGLFGYLSGEIKDLGVVDVNITGLGKSFIGGLVGYNYYHGAVNRCYSTGVISGGSGIGGLVGENYGYVTGCHSTGLVTGQSGVGGLVGKNDAAWSANYVPTRYGRVTECYGSATVTAETSVGGLVGYNEGNVTRCWSGGSVTGKEYIGGLVGRNFVAFNRDYGGTVTQCYSNGAVCGILGLGGGGLVGVGLETFVKASFWDTEKSGQIRSRGGTGKTTIEMQTASTFLEAGWDFVDETENGTEDIWWILEGKDYPRLWWEIGDVASP